MLPVSLVADKTIEYGGPNPYESGHIRACGMDYFERYERAFRRVERIASDAFPEKYQLFIYETERYGRTTNARCAPPCRASGISTSSPSAMREPRAALSAA